MELLYLWIEDDGKTIKNQSFNFSNHITFDFEKIDEKIGSLKLNENSNFIPRFFDDNLSPIVQPNAANHKGSIVNITGIIGENGVGKTNLLHFLIDLFTDRLPLRTKFIIAFKDTLNNSINIFHTIGDFNLTSSGIIKGFKVEEPILQEIYFLVFNYHKKPPSFVENYGLIFYSPVFDLRGYPPDISNEYRDYIDVSTNALIENDVMRSGDIYPDDVTGIELHKFSNIRRQFEMVTNAISDEMQGLNLPKEVNVIFHRDYFDPNAGQRNLTAESERIFKSLNQSTTDAWGLVNSTLTSFDRSQRRNIEQKEIFEDYHKNPQYRNALADKLKIEFSYSFIHNFFRNLSGHYDENIGIKLEDIQGDFLFDRAKFFFENQKWRGRGKWITVQTGKLYNAVLELIDKVDSDRNWINDNANSFTTDISGGTTILNHYEEYITSIPSDSKKNFISTSWRNVSSGENALMDLYSRLYFAKNYKLKEQTQKKNEYNSLHKIKAEDVNFIYLLIDEGEIGFHPQWQSQYLFNLTNFVSQLFNEYNVQIILTSHSPFLVSDLPKENLIFLEKVDGFCTVSSLNQDQTFAANIHSLLADKFFMTEGVIGKFAKNKLQKELKSLLDDSISLDRQRVEKIIAIVGEPVLQSKLKDILKSKLKSDV